jgi:hypothetical protein
MEKGKRQETEGDLIAESYCLNWLAQREREGGGGGRARRGLRRRRVGLSRGEGEERKGEKGRLTSGTQLSAKEKKRKRRRRGLAWGVAGGPLGHRARKGERGKFSFFSFSNSFQTNLLNSNSTKFFSNFPQNFIIFLEITQATKNHAKPNNDAHPLVVSVLIKLSLIF